MVIGAHNVYAIGMYTASGSRESKLPGSSYHLAALGLAMLVLIGFSLMGRLGCRWDSIVGKSAPDFELPVIYNGDPGDMVRLSNLQGQAVVLSFWASWCGPCKATAPSVSRLASRLNNEGVSVIGVNTTDDPKKAVAYADMIKASFPVVFDGDGKVGSLYGVSSLPTIVVIDKNGMVIAKRTGAMDAGSIESIVLSAR